MRRFLVTFLRVAVFLGVGCFVMSCRTGPKHVATDVPGANTNQTSDADAELRLGQATALSGTNAIRIPFNLYSNDRYSGFSSSRSGYNGQTRNILFVERGQKAARWLMQDNDHLVDEVTDIGEGKDAERRVIASVASVRLAEHEGATGTLLLFDPLGKNVVVIADKISRINFSSYEAKEVFVVYERDKKLVQVGYDPRSLAKLRETEIDVPKLDLPKLKG